MSSNNLINSDNLNGETQNSELLKKIAISTFGELKEVVKKAQEENGISSGAINNAKTAFNSFLESRRLKDDSPIGDLFDDEDQFESYLEEYDKYLKGKSKSTRASYVSHVRYHQKIYNLLAEKKLPDTFHKALLELIKRTGFTINRFWQLKVKGIVSQSALRVWCSGKHTPWVKSIEVIIKLEEILGVEEGTLLSRLPRRLFGGSKRPAGLTSYGRKMQKARKNKYGVWTSHLQEQFENLTAVMSSPTRPEEIERNSVWTSSDGAEIPKAEFVQNLLRSFFGFCCLPRGETDPYRNNPVKVDERAVAYNSGLGMDQEKMSLALLAVKHLAVTYLEFQRIRAGGVYTSGTTVFIIMVCSFLRPGTGYIYQHPEFAAHLEGVVEADGLTWHERCIQTRDRLLNIQKDWEEADLIDYGRDPMEPIQQILDLEQPLSIIFLMLEEIKKDMPSPKAS
jgi:hypothetical protein